MPCALRDLHQICRYDVNLLGPALPAPARLIAQELVLACWSLPYSATSRAEHRPNHASDVVLAGSCSNASLVQFQCFSIPPFALTACHLHAAAGAVRAAPIAASTVWTSGAGAGGLPARRAAGMGCAAAGGTQEQEHGSKAAAAGRVRRWHRLGVNSAGCASAGIDGSSMGRRNGLSLWNGHCHYGWAQTWLGTKPS